MGVSKGRVPWLKLGLFAASAGVSYLFFINLCDLIFDCGCRSLWAGAATHCNIHNATPPHCPWCVVSGRYGGVAFTAIVVSQGALAMWPGALTKLRAACALLSFPAVGALAGWLTGIYLGYWK